MIPTSTYRVQFHAGFTFADAIPLASYWRDLGVSHIYASPIAAARKGSIHGYDVVDPTLINRHLGGEAGFRSLVKALRAHGLGVILDIVPNHMAVGGDENAWWLDVLEKGQASRFAHAFDIDWEQPDHGLNGKVLAPFLGGDYRDVLHSGGLRLEYEAAASRLSFVAHDTHRFPIRREDYAYVLAEIGQAELGSGTSEALARTFDPNDVSGVRRLDVLLERQHYKLADWRTAAHAINWRRFFDITELAALRVEDPEVFAVVHALPLRLYAMGLIDGLRIDHVDGLTDPAGYCRRLRKALTCRDAERPEPLRGAGYIVVEKILGPGETLPEDWGVDGATGYEFMNEVSALLHAPAGEAPLTDFWGKVSDKSADFEAEETQARGEILAGSFPGQLEAVVAAFRRTLLSAPTSGDFVEGDLHRATSALVQGFRVYRTYGDSGAAGTSNSALDEALGRAAALAPDQQAELDLLGAWLSGKGPGDPRLATEAARRFRQLTAPVAAKAVEDTAFYRYGRLLSRNDVGFDPGRFSTTAEAFLNLASSRGASFPAGMLTTATHDHKRGEDTRMRLATLSAIPHVWIPFADGLIADAAQQGIHPADGLMLLQAVVGAWPLDLAADAAGPLADFADRVAGWQTKSLREAKLRSNWTSPDLAYEGVCNGYLRRLFTDANTEELRARIHRFIQSIAPAGIARSLVQTGLKLTLPGTPDIYQGDEYWDFSFVDPDNRRPVDYARRRETLGAELGDWRRGSSKQHLIRDLLGLRKAHPNLFRYGSLEQLPLEGSRSDVAMAYQRRLGDEALIVICVVDATEVCMATGSPSLPAGWWGDTRVRSDLASSQAAQDFSGERVFAATLTKRSGARRQVC